MNSLKQILGVENIPDLDSSQEVIFSLTGNEIPDKYKGNPDIYKKDYVVRQLTSVIEALIDVLRYNTKDPLLPDLSSDLVEKSINELKQYASHIGIEFDQTTLPAPDFCRGDNANQWIFEYLSRAILYDVTSKYEIEKEQAGLVSYKIIYDALSQSSDGDLKKIAAAERLFWTMVVLDYYWKTANTQLIYEFETQAKTIFDLPDEYQEDFIGRFKQLDPKSSVCGQRFAVSTYICTLLNQ